MFSQLEKRSTHNVTSGVLNKTGKILISFLCRLPSLVPPALIFQMAFPFTFKPENINMMAAVSARSLMLDVSGNGALCITIPRYQFNIGLRRNLYSSFGVHMDFRKNIKLRGTKRRQRQILAML